MHEVYLISIKSKELYKYILIILILGFFLDYEAYSQTTNSGNKIDDIRPCLLQKLDGQWYMHGNLMGDTVEYKLIVYSVLSGEFTQLHMIDVSDPPAYEAMVYIGFDTKSSRIIAHWLDTSGPAHSIPHGTGEIDNERIILNFPYADSPFRDIFSYHENYNSWSLIIEYTINGAAWDRFAEFKIIRE